MLPGELTAYKHDGTLFSKLWRRYLWWSFTTSRKVSLHATPAGISGKDIEMPKSSSAARMCNCEKDAFLESGSPLCHKATRWMRGKLYITFRAVMIQRQERHDHQQGISLTVRAPIRFHLSCDKDRQKVERKVTYFFHNLLNNFRWKTMNRAYSYFNKRCLIWTCLASCKSFNIGSQFSGC